MDKAICHGDFGYLNCLPLELWHKILRLLPVKSLMTLCAVNKSFISVIHHPDFPSFHLHYNHNPQLVNVNCFSHPDNSCFYGVPELKSFTGIIFTDENSSWYIAGSLNGLLLLVSSHAARLRVLLWNPSIHKYRELSLPTTYLQTFALGYNKSQNDHKIVATGEKSAWLYSVRSNSWTELTWVKETGFRRLDFGVFRFCYDDSLSFKDGAVWTQSEYTNMSLFELVWFDFETERFRYAENMDCRKSRRGLMMLDGGSTVGCWSVQGEYDRTTCIWELEKKTMTWRKRYEIPRQIFPWREGFEMVSFEEENGELEWTYRVFGEEGLEIARYSLKSDSLTSCEEGMVKFDGGFVSAYVESLFMLS